MEIKGNGSLETLRKSNAMEGGTAGSYVILQDNAEREGTIRVCYEEETLRIPYAFIFSQRVFRLMPSIFAAFVLLPRVVFSTSRI